MENKKENKVAYFLGGMVGGVVVSLAKLWLGLYILNYFNWLPF